MKGHTVPRLEGEEKYQLVQGQRERKSEHRERAAILKREG